ncbi:MAG: MFS transporter [Haloarculaceae archaeon]
MARFHDTQAGLVVSLVGGSHVVNHMYFMLLPPITGALATDLDVSVAEVGLAIGLVGGVVTALQLPFGHLSDTRGRWPVLAVSLSFGAVGALLTATAQSYAWLLLAQVVLGVGIAGHHPAHYPLLSAATDPGARGRAFSVHGFTGAIGFAAPPAIVGAAGALGFDWRVAMGAIAVAGALYGVVALLALRDLVDEAVTAPPEPAPKQAPERASGRAFWSLGRLRRLPSRAVAGFRDLASSRGIVLLTVLWLLTSMGAWGIKTQTIPLLTGGYGLAENTANLLVSTMFVLGAVLMFGGGWLTDRTSPGLVLVVGYVAFVAITAALATGGLPLPLVVVLTLLLAATIDYSRPARSTLGDALSSQASMGKNFGLLTIGISGGAAVAPPVLGYLASESGEAMAFAAMAGLGVVTLALTLVVVRLGDTTARASPHPDEYPDD